MSRVAWSSPRPMPCSALKLENGLQGAAHIKGKMRQQSPFRILPEDRVVVELKRPGHPGTGTGTSSDILIEQDRDSREGKPERQADL